MDIIKSQSEQEHTLKLLRGLSILITKTLQEKDTVVIAVSGGKSPIPLFEGLSNLDLPWHKITIVLVDERVIATNHEDSNENLVKTHLLKNKALSAKFVGLMHSDQHIILTKANHNHLPIDIAILGMGADGHTASIFPDCSELDYALDQKNHNTYIITNPISAKYQRITLTLNALKQVKHLILTLNGEEKYQVFTEAQKKENKNYPISYLINQRPDIQIYWQE